MLTYIVEPHRKACWFYIAMGFWIFYCHCVRMCGCLVYQVLYLSRTFNC